MADWTIVKKEQVTARDSTGQYVPAVRITFTVGADGPFSVDVPVASFTQQAATDLISAYVAHLNSVG